MPRSEWATERFIYLHDISQADSVKRYCACTALVTDKIVPAQRVEYSLTESALFPFQAEPTQFNSPGPIFILQ